MCAGRQVLWLYSLLYLVSSTQSTGVPQCQKNRIVKPSYYLPPTTCTGEHIKSAVQSTAKCVPRPKIVKIPWPNNTDVHQLNPTHVTVSRCGGSCLQSSQICVSVSTRTREVPVLLGKCGITAGRCDKECASVAVVEDVECGCRCSVREEDCTAQQHYVRDLCSCQCRDLSRAALCHESGRVWEPASCTCQCPASLECSTGLVFDKNDTCSCVPVTGGTDTAGVGEGNSGNSDKRKADNSWLVPTTEIVIIGLLLGVIVIFFIITVTTLRLNCNLRRKLRKVLETSASERKLFEKCEKNVREGLAIDETTMQLLESETDFSSERPTDSSLCSDSVRTQSPHTTPPSETESFNRFRTHDRDQQSLQTADRVSLNTFRQEQQNNSFKPRVSVVESRPNSRSSNAGSLANSRLSVQNSRLPNVESQSVLLPPRPAFPLPCLCSGRVPSPASEYNNCHPGHPDYHQVGHCHQGQVGQVGQVTPGQGTAPYQLGQPGHSPRMGQPVKVYPVNNGRMSQMGQGEPILELGQNGSLLRMGQNQQDPVVLVRGQNGQQWDYD